MSNFAFLAAEFPAVHEAAVEAERQAGVSPTAAAFFAGKTVEVAVKWAFRNDSGLKLPYQDNIAALLHEPSFRRAAGEAVFAKAKLINTLRNRAVHEEKTIRPQDAAGAVKELFHVCFWLARTYARRDKPAEGLVFDASVLARRDETLKRAFAHLKAQQAELDAKNGELARLLGDKASLDEELRRLRAEVAATRRAAEATPSTHDYNEAETRDRYIDLLLREAGWALDRPEDTEFRVDGMPNNEGVGFVDYVLWGADGKPLGLVEAKRTRKDARQGQQQAKLYADRLEARYGQRPVIFYSNGYEHWIWDDVRHPPRQVGGFYKRDELELLVQRRTGRRKLAETRLNTKIAGDRRPYQQRAIRSIAKAFEEEGERKALLVMATGSGKTRTVIALVDLLMRAGWVKRVLFLADRVALVNQAAGAFKAHLPDSAPVNLVTERTSEGRVFLSTYPTMMNLIDGRQEGRAKFGPGHFDLIVIDEAHRSVYQRFRAIFDYFDSFLVGLTPKDEIDKNTYSLFDLEDGVPTDAYSLEEAVADGHLVPPLAISVPLKIVRSGLRYDDLSEEEKDQWDMLEWGEEDIPDSVDAAEVNKRLFNTDTVDQVIAHLMQNGLKVEGGDRLGKTIIFAKNQQHAQFIEARFNAAYPSLAGHFARVITYESGPYAQTLIDDFSRKDKAPHIAISVDMLDTGIDVPEVVNLVFFKQLRSKTKFWQMMGRGTRLCPDLFGPGRDKEFFRVFDYCQNLEFFGANPQMKEASAAKSLSARLFAARVDLVRALDDKRQKGFEAGDQAPYDGPAAPETPPSEEEVAASALAVLRETIAGLNLDNFIVRQKRRTVEKYREDEAWTSIDEDKRCELVDDIAPLPSSRELGTEEAKRFDLLMFQLELALLKGSKRFEQLKKQLLEIASALEDQAAIPGIVARAALIEEIQTAGWWEGVTVPLLEFVRLRLRDLIQHIDKGRKAVVYSNFADEIGIGEEIELPQVGEADFARFKAKARHFLNRLDGNLVLDKVRHGKPLTAYDLAELERLLRESGIAGPEDIARARDTSHGFGRFVRSLVGLDRAAVNEAFAGFIAHGGATHQQIEFIGLVVEHLTEKGSMDPAILYEAPFVDIAPTGPDQVFDNGRVEELFRRIEDFNSSADVAERMAPA
ncbi:DEAD/DEAH box helicase family protein [Mesorhizobium yinganensis]|uniref:DEAD/DEAH box helicase family protein n=1 Tax=Mesorhizobium yinganensis TaxID=3157707 RepID=UPI0032B78A66